MTDGEIKMLIRTSPDEGYRALFDEYWQYTYTIICQMLRGCGRLRAAEECTSDVLSDVMLNYDTAYEGSLKAYIGTTARRRAIDICRSSKKRDSITSSLDCEDAPEISSSEDIAYDAERSELTRLLIEQINALGEPDSVIIIQKYFFERNSIEIGRLIGMNPITVRNRLSRALKRLKPVLEKLDITL
ncbi:MAG: sigma-70 family RNA polymerase sigma factor [Ruminococcus sp.]|nr:sigma-70 family RNA polymerase sigma factor [Ruminococcus sp.]